MQDAFSALETCSAVTIACIDGVCIGAGIELVLACDIVYCTKRSKFCIKETAFGFAADVGLFQRGAQKLTKNIGLFKELAFTAQWFDAHVAFDIGLVSRIFENSSEIMSQIVILKMSSTSKTVIEDIKSFINYSVNNGPLKGLEYARLFNSGVLIGNPLMSSKQAKL